MKVIASFRLKYFCLYYKRITKYLAILLHSHPTLLRHKRLSVKFFEQLKVDAFFADLDDFNFNLISDI